MFRCFTPGVRKSLAPHRRDFTLVPNFCGLSLRNLLHVTFWRLEFSDGSWIFVEFVPPCFYSVFPNVHRDSTSTYVRPFRFTSFLIHCPLIIITFDAVQCELQILPRNTPIIVNRL
jgi:hypothetical protein